MDGWIDIYRERDVYIYTYVERKRERERERERGREIMTDVCLYMFICMLL